MRYSGTKESPEDRPFSRNRKFRIATNFALLFFGLFLTSLPAWAIDASDVVGSSLVAGAGGVLMGFGLGALIEEWLDPTYDSVVEAFAIQAAVGVPGNFRGIIHEQVSAALAEVASSSVEFGPRGRLAARLQLASSEQEILVQSISLSQKWQTTQILEELFKHRSELRVKIALMHPYSPHVALREQDLGFQPGTLRQLIDETIQPLASLKTALNLADRLEVRGYLATPYFGLTCCDQKRAMISLSREKRGGDQNTAIYVERGSETASEMISDLVNGFQGRWASSKDILEFVSVSFVPGSERSADGRIDFLFESDAALAQNSIVCTSRTATEILITTDVAGDALHRYRVAAKFHDPNRVQTFEIAEATTESGAWLRSPVMITLPPPASIQPLA